MKVSYIILPFTDSTFLVRCINSLYRQLGEDFEVILAENDFGDRQEEIEEFLDGKPQVLRIDRMDFPETEKEDGLDEFSEITGETVKTSSAEKLNQAFDLISEDSGYVMLVDVNTVVSPICAKTILGCEESDLIIPAAAIKKGDNFIADNPEIYAVQKNYDKYIPQRFCFGISKFKEFEAKFTENQELFSIFLLSILADTERIKKIEDICIYVKSFDLPVSDEDVEFEIIKTVCEEVLEKLLDIEEPEARVTVFEKLINKVLPFIRGEKSENGSNQSEGETAVRETTFDLLQKFYIGVQNNLLLKTIIELKTGYDTETFLALNYKEYVLYKSYKISAKDSYAAAVDYAAQNKLLKEMKSSLETVKKELLDTKAEVLAIKNKPVIQQVVSAPETLDPYTDIPKMYREGRLGLKTIWRSFWSWFKFKFSKKK